jgi:hypothetical protein
MHCRQPLRDATTRARRLNVLYSTVLDALRLWKLQLAVTETGQARDILDYSSGTPDGTAPVLLEEEASCGPH